MPQDQHKTIFVSIASYRDPDCINTVLNLFEQAAHPQRLAVGICWQFVPGEEPALLQIFELQEQLRQVSLPVRYSKGPCLARHLTQKLWQDEDYYFQIDSHMRFAPAWDEKLISLLGQCPSAKPVLSTYPLSFTPPDILGRDALVEIRPRYFDSQGILHQHSALIQMPDQRPVPSSTYFVSAGMLFTHGKIIEEVPYDPYIYFAGEEIALALRLWTHGWDIYNPNAVIAYHNYQLKTERRRHWEDQAGWTALNQASVNRIKYLTGQNPGVDSDNLVDIHLYGLGSKRSVDDYEKASGLDFTRLTWHGKNIEQS